MRGEKHCVRVLLDLSGGSPPRARGKDLDDLHGGRVQGITPACAGKSPSSTRAGASARDHPRVRGEKGSKILSCGFELGSPPRARGKEMKKTCEKKVPGITPACAGKSQRNRRSAASLRDHPRVRGEKCTVVTWMRGQQGSPPRARGKEDRLLDRHALFGITPACAGKSRCQCCWRCGRRDHPRVRGEKFTHWLGMLDAWGSPPRARGKVAVRRRQAAQHGITPACAGKSAI